MIRYATFLFFSLTVVFGYLSYDFYGRSTSLRGQLENAQALLVSAEHSLDMKTHACEVADIKAKELIDKLQQEQQARQSHLGKIDKIPKTCAVGEMKTDAKDNFVDIDAVLPPALTSVLRESYLQVQ
ncbi:hypothetical protein D3C85_801330 [compost metagenome]